jgi:rod shape-determining protein MreC
MKKKKQYSIANKYWLLFLSLACIALMFLSAYSDTVRGPFRVLANVTVIPMQSGINTLGTFLIDITENFETMEMLQADNEELRTQIIALQEENSRLQVDESELERLQTLFRLDQEYAEYDKIGAIVIGAEGSNWFSNITINRGSLHGVRVNMNVIAEGGLVGIVTEVGPTWANVRTIIDDTSNVSGMVLHTSDRCIVRGDLSLINEGRMRFEQMENNENPVAVGDRIVTSPISNLFLQGFTIGYIVEINVDANNLTRFGYLVPAVDFRNIREVLVVMQTKADLTGQDEENILESDYDPIVNEIEDDTTNGNGTDGNGVTYENGINGNGTINGNETNENGTNGNGNDSGVNP